MQQGGFLQSATKNRRRTVSRFTRTGWKLIPAAAAVQALVGVDMKVYQKDLDDGHLTVIVGKEDGKWHLSISHRTNDLQPGRYPTWDEIHEARYEFCPPKALIDMILPPKEEYVNFHPTTFHLWEIER